MNQDAQENFLSSGLVGSCAERGSELAFVLGERAFDMGPLGVDMARESALERSTVSTLGPLPGTAHVDGSHQRANTQKLSAEFVMMLAVVGGVSQNLIQRNPQGAFQEGRSEVRRVVAGTYSSLGGQPQVASGVAEYRQLRRERASEALGIGPFVEVMEAGVPDFKSGGIDGSFWFFLDQAAAVGSLADRVEESIETPFFRRRW